MKKLIALALALLMALSFALVGCGEKKKDSGDRWSSEIENVAKAYMRASGDGKPEESDGYLLITREMRLKKYAKEEDLSLKKYLEENYDVSSMKEYWENEAEEFKENIAEKYGEEYRFTIEVLDVDEFTNKEIDKFKEDYEERFDNYGLDIDKVESVAQAILKVKVSGSEDSDRSAGPITLVKYKGDWKVWG